MSYYEAIIDYRGAESISLLQLKWQLVNMGVDENRRFFVDHVRAVWLWIRIVIADCLKRIKISGWAGGLPAILCFSNVQCAVEKHSFN
jgi:hypothetical protein